MTDKLLPCPFCGGAPKLRTHRCAEDAMECHVECPNCEVRTAYYEGAYAPTADAIAAWNRRSVPKHLEDALKPFAKLAENYSNACPSDAVFAKGCVFVYELRQAAAAMLAARGSRA